MEMTFIPRILIIFLFFLCSIKTQSIILELNIHNETYTDDETKEKLWKIYINHSGDACLSKPEGISYYPGPG